MKAIVQAIYGTTDVLDFRDVDQPTIGDSEVLVRVRAAGVDRGVVHVMNGLPYPLRLAGYGLRVPKNRIPGRDVSGVVEAVGPAVTRFQPGDEVFGIAEGSFAEVARAADDKLAPKPTNLSFAEAAAVAVSGMTALQAVRDHAQVKSGQQVLVIGASGGVGTYAVQLAKLFGAQVTAVCSAAKADVVRALGADHVVDYRQDDFLDGGRRYDAILDIGGNASLARLRRGLLSSGRLVIVGGETGGRWLGGSDRQLRALLLSRFVNQTLTTFVAKENREDMMVLKELVEAGKLTPVIDRTYTMVEIPQAIRYVEEGRARGKVVITA